MSAHIAVAADDIRTFLPAIGEEENAQRAKLRSLRNAAAAMISATDSGNARQLAWMASDIATETMYAPAAANALDEVNKFCTRLMIVSMQAEKIDLFGAGE